MGAIYFWYERRIMKEHHKDRKMIIQYIIRVTYFWYARRIMEVHHKDRKMTIQGDVLLVSEKDNGGTP